MAERREKEHGLKPEIGYERRDVKVKYIIKAMIAFVLLFTFILVMLNELFLFTKEQVINENFLSDKSDKLIILRSHEDSVLTNYKVLDEENGIYQIPIERALELVAEDAKK